MFVLLTTASKTKIPLKNNNEIATKNRREKKLLKNGSRVLQKHLFHFSIRLKQTVKLIIKSSFILQGWQQLFCQYFRLECLVCDKQARTVDVLQRQDKVLELY